MIKKVLLFLMLAGLSSSLQAEKISLQIYANRFDSIPIGIVDFKSKNGPALKEDQPWQIIARDFDLSSRFHVLNRPSFDSAAFSDVGASLYIDGEYSVEGSAVAFTIFVNDMGTKEHLLTKEYKGDLKSLRALSHRFSGELYELLFGDKGIFESRILYVKRTAEGKNIAVMDFDGFHQRQITKGKVLCLFPALADSTTAYWVTYQRGKPDICRGSILDGKNKIIVASKGIQVSPAASIIDGRLIYGSSKNGNLDIYSCNRDGGDTKQLTVSGAIETAPCWSPNGYQIAFTSDRSGNPQIYVMDADGGNQHRLTYKSFYCDAPAWSPRGDKIAFTSMKKNGILDIWTIAPDGSNEVEVTTLPGFNEYPTWSPDGRLIGFIHRAGGTSDFYIVKPDGTGVKQVTTSGDVLMPDWGNYQGEE
jgi:TolB protein